MDDDALRVVIPRNLSLRDLFALQAMNALLGAERGTPFQVIANHAYGAADAMLAERAKQGLQ